MHEDDRQAVYQEACTASQLSQQEQANQFSADFILSQALSSLCPEVACSMSAVASAPGVAIAQSKGVTDILGIEGKWLDRNLARVPEKLIVDLDLEQPFDLGRRGFRFGDYPGSGRALERVGGRGRLRGVVGSTRWAT